MKYYSHHIGDFDKKTRHLTRLERSVYRDMLDLYYDTEEPLSPDQEVICRKIIARSPEEREAVKQVLSEFFTRGDDGWHNSRCDEEIAVYQAKREKAAASARKRWDNESKLAPHSEIYAKAMPTHSEGNANHEPITNNQESIGESTREAPSPDDAKEAFDAWNRLASETGLSEAQRLTPQRRASLTKRLSECGGLPGWEAALAKIRGSPFCNGANSNGWRADLDFVLQASSFTRLMEGRYDEKQPRPSATNQRKPTLADAFADFDADFAAAVNRTDHGSEERSAAPVIELSRVREGIG